VKGIFLHQSSFGYTVHIDGHTMDLDVSWTEADKLATDIASLRNKSGKYDGRGYARCRHEGNSACFHAQEHLPSFETCQ
jgi:hypothetical protein